MITTTLTPRTMCRPAASTQRRAHRGRAMLLCALCALAPAALLLPAGTATAAVPNVDLATAANYAVLGGSGVTDAGSSSLDGSLGVWPGSDLSGVTPGTVLPPWVIDATNAAAQQAQSDLTAAYVDAANRPIDATTTADLGGLTLQAGVYAGPSKGALGLTGTLTLDGGGDPGSVFVFQTDSTLITASSSSVVLINGAQECNVYWQVLSSATLGTDSVFAGNILALTSVTVTTNVTVHGRALARNGAVTLDNDVFTQPTCEQTPPVTTTTMPGETTTTVPGGTTTTVSGATTNPTTSQPGGFTTLVGVETSVRSSVPVIPATGSDTSGQSVAAISLIAVGVTCVTVVRRRRTS